MKFAPQLKFIKHKRLASYLDGKYVDPINVEISPSGRCQQNCSWCFFKNEKNLNMIDSDLLHETLLGFQDMEVKAVTWSGGGEPTLHKDFNQFAQTLYSLHIKQGLFTNGWTVNYDPRLFNWIRVSYTNDGWGDLYKLRECKSLGMCINYTGDDSLIESSLKTAQQVGADYLQVRPAFKPKGEFVDYEMPKIKHELLKLTDYKFEDANKGKDYSMCEGYHLVPYIDERGRVLVCPYRWEDDNYILGDLRHTSFREIMQNAPRFKSVTSSCQVCCKLHESNKLINNLRKIEDGDFV